MARTHRKQRPPVAWLVLSVGEPIPVDDRAPDGPFYQPGPMRYFAPEESKYAELCAQMLRDKGFTVTLATEVR